MRSCLVVSGGLAGENAIPIGVSYGMEAADQASRSSSAKSVRRLLVLLLAGVAIAGGYRAAQLAIVDSSLCGIAERQEVMAADKERTSSGPATNKEPAANKGHVLSSHDLSLLAMACPQSLDSMPPELRAALEGVTTEAKSLPPEEQPTRLAPPSRQTAYRQSAERQSSAQPRARITGVRVANRPSSIRVALQTPDAKDWLVPPDDWYVPEDRATAPPASTQPAGQIAEPQTTEPTPTSKANEVDKSASGQPAVPPVPDEPKPVERAEPAVTDAPRSEPAEVQTPAVEPPLFEAPARASDPPTVEPPIIESPAAATSDESVTNSTEGVREVVGNGVVENPYLSNDESATPMNQVDSLPEPEQLPIVDDDSVAPTEQVPALPQTEEVHPGVKRPAAIPLDLTLPSVPRNEQHFAPPAANSSRDSTPTREGGDEAIQLPEQLSPKSLPEPPSIFAPPSAAPAANAPTMLKSAPPTLPASPHGQPAKKLTKEEQANADKSHRELFQENCYPSARDCAKCHKKQYEEWSISSHAYAFVSPMFHKFEQKITSLSQGTVGYFCMRCHSPTAVAMCESRDTPIWEMAEVAREGVTCIACHRVNEAYAKTNGERRIVPGDIYDPVYGGIGGKGIAKAIADKAKYKVKTSPDEKGAGQPIHREGRFFKHLSQAEFCTSCHQVAVHPGIKLEVVWEQYRASPACKKGVTCQHCHMGTVPGVPSPYELGSIAEVGGKSVCESREHANHTFYGPGYSIAHPGIFPFHKDGNRWKMPDWLAFDWRSGWGTDDFEDAVDDGKIQITFPKVWEEADDRYDAREIIDDNIARLRKKRELRRQVMEHGSKVTGPHFKHSPRRCTDLKFDYIVTNLNEGHNLPTASLGAQPQLWANVVLINPNGQRVWETGYTDAYGDLADIHSEEVRHGRIAFDSQLFNLQTMFLITGATGTDRELPLPVNVSFDQVPLLRPGALPISVLNHPPFIRMESRSIAPLGSKRVKYKVPADRLTVPGRYRLSFRLRNRTEPIYFMRFCESTDEMQRSMNEGILDIHPYSVEFEVR